MSNEQGQNVQSLGDHRNIVDLEKIRRLALNKIYDYLMMRKQQQSRDISAKSIIYLTTMSEMRLFNAASTLDEYMNLDTLENRLITALKQYLRNRRKQRLLQQQQQMNEGFGNQNQQLQQQQQLNSGFWNQSQQSVQHGNSFGNISTIFPTPVTGGFLPFTSGMGSASSSNGYQHPTSVFPTTTGSNSMVSSMGGGEIISNQMMPTPGFVNTNNTDADMSLESSMVVAFQLLNL